VQGGRRREPETECCSDETSKDGKLLIVSDISSAKLLQGSKIRSTYIAFAHKEKARLEERTAALEKEIKAKELEVQRLKGTQKESVSRDYSLTCFTDNAERTESMDAAVLKRKKQSRECFVPTLP
jgi:hypothetical protein